MHDYDEPITTAIACFWDHWRRLGARLLVEERGLPADLVQAVWDAIPCESVPFRFGWEERRRRHEATG